MNEIYKPSVEAVDQSNRFACGFPISEPLENGFLGLDFGSRVSVLGVPIQTTSPTVFLKTGDADLKNFLLKLNADLAGSKDILQITTLVRNCLYSPNKQVYEIESWYDQLIAMPPKQLYKLGYFIANGMGMCTQVSMLIKISCDQLGIPCILTPGLKEGRHVWCTSGKMIYDAGLPHHLAPATDLNSPEYKSHAEIYGDSHYELSSLYELIFSSTTSEALIEGHLKLLGLEERVSGEESLARLNSLRQLGFLLKQQKRYNEAVTYYDKAYPLVVKLLSPGDVYRRGFLDERRSLRNEMT